MEYQELREMFRGILNRNDCDNTKADFFLGMGLTRVERILRTPLQKITRSVTVDGTYEPIVIPDDFLSLRVLKVNNVTMRRETETSYEPDLTSGCDPEHFVFRNNTILINPAPRDGAVITLTYYATFPRDMDDEDKTAFSVVIPDVVVYAALVFAADYYLDVRKVDWEGSFQTLAGEVQLQADLEEMSGGLLQIRNPYEGIV